MSNRVRCRTYAHTLEVRHYTKGVIRIKALWVGDLHLYDREMKTTKGMVKNNLVMLEGLYDFIEQDPEISIILFAGDIQHKTPRKLKESYQWRVWFKKLGHLMQSRWDEHNLWEQVTIIYRDEPPVMGAYPVFSLRGNHDSEVINRRQDDFTFFDELEQEGLIQNPKALITDTSYIDFRNYGEADLVNEGQDVPVITLLHDLVYHSQSKSYIDLIKQTQPDTSYDAHQVLLTTDLALVGHIHDPEDVVTEQINGREVRILQGGSMGRTSATQVNYRDIGYTYTVDLDTLSLTKNEIPLLPYKEFFDIRDILKRTHKQDEFADFSLTLEDVEMSQYSVVESIQAAVGVDAKVKQEALRLLEQEQLKER